MDADAPFSRQELLDYFSSLSDEELTTAGCILKKRVSVQNSQIFRDV